MYHPMAHLFIMLLLEISVRMVEKQLIVMKEDLFYFKELMKNMMFLT